jgi:hypothetical protein
VREITNWSYQNERFLQFAENYIEKYTEELLVDLERRGEVYRDGEGWRITEKGRLEAEKGGLK